ncbi:ABC transporter substrate-binding protein [Agromyces bauzanensis]
MYTPLIQITSKGDLAPGLAAEWSAFDENRGFELKLRSGVTFSDGEPLTPEGVKDWFEYFASSGGSYSKMLGEFESIETEGEDTVRIHFANPNPSVADILAASTWGQVVSPAALEDPSVLDTESFGAGPYVLDSAASVAGSSYVLTPNKNFFDPSLVAFDEVRITVIEQPNSMLQAIQAGQLDVAVGNPATAAAAESSGLEVVSAPSAVTAYVFTDLDGTLAPPLGDVRVRQAINYAIDREAIISAVANGFGEPSSQLASRDGWDPDLQDYYEYDPERAKQLMSETPFSDGVTLTLLERPVDSDLTQAVASYLSEIGISLEVTTAATNADYVRQIQEKSYALVVADFYGDRTAWFQHTGALGPNGLFNSTDWTSDYLDVILNRNLTSTSGEGWSDWSRYVTEQAVTLPVLMKLSVFFVADTVQDVNLTQESGGYSNPLEWKPTS